MDFQIHCMETEAYGAVLRAFIAQSEVLSWGKEVFITDLRKELRVSDVEHREILGKLNLDDSIKSIREQRKSIDGQQLTVMNPPVSIAMFEGHESRKKLKLAQTPGASFPIYQLYARNSQVSVPSSLESIMHVYEDETFLAIYSSWACPAKSDDVKSLPILYVYEIILN